VEVYTRGLRQGEPASYVTTYNVDPTSRMITSVIYPRGNRTDYTYSAALNLTEVRHRETNTGVNQPSDIVHSWLYGAFSQRSQYTDPLGNVTTYTLDGSGNTTQVNHPTVTSPASQAIVETYAFDARGRITSATDGASRSVGFTYYTTGPQTGYLQSIVRDPSPGLDLTTTFTYSQYGDVTSITDPRSSTTTITVDAEGYVEEIEAPSPLNYHRRFTYSPDRQVTLVEVENRDKDGNLDPNTPWIDTALQYDEIGRLTAKTVRLTANITATTS
jgi:YD repeat-containing protein